MQSQVRGLAAALTCPQVVEKTCGLRLPWRWLPNRRLWAHLAAAEGDSLTPPWPDLLISCGRKAALLSMAVRRASGGRVRTVHIQDPLVDPAAFDLVVVPQHDHLRGDNVLVSRGALHRVTPQLLASAADRFEGAIGRLPRPRLALLTGGSNRYFASPPDWLRQLGGEAATVMRQSGGSVLATISRRTPADARAALRDALVDVPHDYWEGEGENPYLAYLALADAILVTGDSTSMISEACATGAPVHVALPPLKRPARGVPHRFAAFYDSFRAAGAISWWEGGRSWTTAPGELPQRVTPLNDTAEIAAAVTRRLHLPEGAAAT
ncbi:mitochondrial fission ELM1 family protein [Marinibaculum pumilum]|uniref:Mitochondrial fission ELM1 family protein n=1 Tax=Marinibaculum pumilum TaxID=1766165 RepID=A0ABV7KV46_9PROT